MVPPLCQTTQSAHLDCIPRLLQPLTLPHDAFPRCFTRQNKGILACFFRYMWHFLLFIALGSRCWSKSLLLCIQIAHDTQKRFTKNNVDELQATGWWSHEQWWDKPLAFGCQRQNNRDEHCNV